MKPWKVEVTKAKRQYFVMVSIFRDDFLYHKDVIFWTKDETLAKKVAQLIEELLLEVGKAWINKFIGI